MLTVDKADFTLSSFRDQLFEFFKHFVQISFVVFECERRKGIGMFFIESLLQALLLTRFLIILGQQLNHP